jgi:hypothetical protein
MDRLSFVGLALFAVTAGLGSGCGSSIGDSCTTSTDCAQDGTRICDFTSPDGYCTIEGCDFDTCPEEAVCVRFYPGLMTDKTCDPEAAEPGCGFDEICTVQRLCAPRTLERRFCMFKCDGNGVCRDHYECRTRDIMELHGGEPVPDPNSSEPQALDQGFCAARQGCVFATDCVDPGYTCVDRFCEPQ